MFSTLRLFWQWYRRCGGQTKLLIVLVIIATFMGCFGALTPPAGSLRPSPTPTRTSHAPPIRPVVAALAGPILPT